MNISSWFYVKNYFENKIENNLFDKIIEEEKGFSHLHSKLTEAETKLEYSRRERTDLESKVIIRSSNYFNLLRNIFPYFQFHDPRVKKFFSKTIKI